MGNNRQQIKDKLAKDIRSKIEQTQKMLIQLQESIENVEKSGVDAKLQVDSAVDELSQQLVRRKLELHDQIEKICQSQIRVLRENVEAAYVRLGNLQSMSDNLELVDGSQLGNVRVPHLPGMLSTPPVLQLNVDTTAVSNAVEKWGSAAAKKTDPISDLNANIASVMEKYVFRPELKRSMSVCSREGSCKLKTSNASDQLLAGKTNSAGANENDQKDWHVEQWLSRMKIRNANSSSTIADDFEMVSESEATEKRTEEPQPTFQISSPTKIVPIEKLCDGREDGSSIVCVENEELTCLDEEDELSKWLKPKKTKRLGPSCSDESIEVCMQEPEPLSDVSNTNNENIENIKPAKNQKLDFPCLRADPGSWTCQRKAKCKSVSKTGSLCKPELCLQVGQNEIIPPQYALPYPFWLKKR